MSNLFPNSNRPFKKGFKITQLYGNDVPYYSQVSGGKLTLGHEGLDLIPIDLNDWDIYAIEEGVVVRDTDLPRDFGAYGNLVVIWNEKHKRAWWYAHNSNNLVSMGQKISSGQKISKMGTTGNSTGAHLHLGLRESDAQGNPINTNNGNLGYIDPLPIVIKLTDPTYNDSTMEYDPKKRMPENWFTLISELKKLVDKKLITNTASVQTLAENSLKKIESLEEENKNVAKTQQETFDKTLKKLKTENDTKLSKIVSDYEAKLTKIKEESTKPIPTPVEPQKPLENDLNEKPLSEESEDTLIRDIEAWLIITKKLFTRVYNYIVNKVALIKKLFKRN